MRVAPRANLTITLLRHQSLGEERLLGLGPQSAAAPPAGPSREPDRVDLVHPGKPPREESWSGYLFDQAGDLYPSPLGPTYAGPSPHDPAEADASRGDNVPAEAPRPEPPNRLPEPADSGGGNLIDVYA